MIEMDKSRVEEILKAINEKEQDIERLKAVDTCFVIDFNIRLQNYCSLPESRRNHCC